MAKESRHLQFCRAAYETVGELGAELTDARETIARLNAEVARLRAAAEVAWREAQRQKERIKGFGGFP